jgi:hypothetical protein
MDKEKQIEEMTNREKLESLDNLKFTEALYEIKDKIGLWYTISTQGIADWLGKPYDFIFWKSFENKFCFEV